jgi:hypothetical protein
VPFDFGDLTACNIDIERSVTSDSFLPAFLGNDVMTGRERDFEAALLIGRELRNCAGLIADTECHAGQWL